MSITIEDVRNIIKKLKIDMSVFKFKEKDLLKGCKVEFEHGTRFKMTNITNNDYLLTFKIALAHLYEFPDYYERLENMEKEADKYWKNKNKFNVEKINLN